MSSTAEYLQHIQELESRAENLRENIVALKLAKKDLRAGNPERKKVDSKLADAKERLKVIKAQVRESKVLLREESVQEIRRERESGKENRVGRPPKGEEEAPKRKRGRPRKEQGIVIERGKRGRPRKEVVELSSFRKEVNGLREEMNLMNAKIDRLSTLMQTMIKRGGR